MIELNRHAPVGRQRRRPVLDRPRGLVQLYAARQRRPLPDLYAMDRAEARRGGRFRWFFSTCLAATVGAIAIAAVIFGSLDANFGSDGMLPALRRQAKAPPRAPTAAAPDGLRWAVAKSDRLLTATGAMSTKYVVQDSINERRGNREYIQPRFFSRMVVRLAAVPAKSAVEIPAFNPLKLYASGSGGEDGERDHGSRPEGGEINVRVVELLGSILPTEDGQELDNQEVTDIVNRSAIAGPEDAAIRPTFVPEGADIVLPRPGASNRPRLAAEPLAPNTSVLEKTSSEPDEIADETESQQVKVKLARGETLKTLLQRMGADAWQATDMAEKARSVIPESQIVPGLDVELTMVPSLTQAGKLEPMRVTLLGSGGEHRVTVGRNGAGEFVASVNPVETSAGRGTTDDGGEQPAAASLYASLYQSALALGVPADTIQQILRVHAYETDFRRRARGSDSIELFFDLKDEGRAADNPPGELLYTAITVGGETQRYFRFRTPDNLVDYYDEAGNNSRKFLMRKPIRNDEVRFVSGFGMRRHPLLNVVKMHTGVDWAGSVGTPIVASGNGVVEEAGFKGQNGNYVRIRHANGYQTAYSHMIAKFGAGIREGAKVRQGQIIGYIGNTGLSTGPHLHFEILVGNRFVDPMSIQVPKERKLTGKQLTDFQRERARVEELMRRPPVRVAQLDGK